MKKILALLLALCLCLGLSASLAEGTLWEVSTLRLNKATNTFAMRKSWDDPYYVVDADGNILSEGYATLSDMNNGFEVTDDDGLNVRGFLNGQGQLVMPMQYGDIAWISDRWMAGIVLVEATEADYDYKSIMGDGFYQIERVDVYYGGAMVGTLNRQEYHNGTAYGDYLMVWDHSGNLAFYNKAMEKSAFEAQYSTEYDQDYRTDVITHCGSNQPAFVPECTLTADEVTQSIWVDFDGVAKDLQGNVLFDLGDTYDYYDNFEGDYLTVRLNDLYGVLDKTGREVLPCEYDDIFIDYAGLGLFANGYQMVSKDGKVGFVDVNGNAVSGFTYSTDAADTYYPPFVSLQGLDGLYIVISPLGEMSEHYAEVDFERGRPVFCAQNVNGVAGVVDLAGNVLIPFDGTFEDTYDLDISNDGTLACGMTDDGFMVYKLNPVK